jgi:putative methionine-R-sulfoxide reductase with GAF domain
MSSGALDAIETILSRGGDADDVLRAVVATIASEPGVEWAGISFLENDALTLGPQEGTPDALRRTNVPVVYQGTRVGELAVDGQADVTFLEHVALVISAHVLLGWDTDGESWDP